MASGGSGAGGTNTTGTGGVDVITPVVPPYGAPPVGGSNDMGGAGGIGDVELIAGAPAAGSGVGGAFIGIPR